MHRLLTCNQLQQAVHLNSKRMVLVQPSEATHSLFLLYSTEQRLQLTNLLEQQFYLGSKLLRLGP
jgi:hypothetical protein